MGGNGLTREREFFAGLERRGFRLAPPSTELDRTYKVDRVVQGPPLPEGICFFPAPIAVQFTTLRGDWGKRAVFVASAGAVASRLAYIELHEAEVTEEVLGAAHAALLHLFHCFSAPRTALIILRANQYELRDLEADLPLYRRWVEAKLEGEILGWMDYWDPERRYGFAMAEVVGPSGRSELVAFFLHINAITDPVLRSRLGGLSGNLSGRDRVRVVFTDGSGLDEEQERKVAVNVRRAGQPVAPIERTP